MNEEYRTIADTQLSKAMNVIYNVWFEKWKRIKDPTPDQWELCIAELNYVLDQGNFTVLITIAQALITELDQRWRSDENNS